MTLTQKETMLLKDLISQETLCVSKYTKASSEAFDGGLKNLFSEICKIEQTHLDTLNTISSGNIPNMSNTPAKKPISPTTKSTASEQDKNKDKYLCSDTLETEKHASGLYDTCIFEFSQPELRNILNHIQKEEQEHGEQIYNYMSLNNMYS